MRRARLLALPLALGALSFVTIRLAVAPLGDAIAGAIADLVKPSPVRASSAPAEPIAAEELGGEPGAGVYGPPAALPRRLASRAPVPRRETLEETKDGGARTPSPADAPRSTIVVPASVVTRAIERRDVGATNALAADGTPMGARLAGVSKYRAGLRDGDVVVSVAGTRTPTVETMVAVGLKAASGGATRISGRILRGDAPIAVVIELPQ